jgi:hypothetical protein
MAVKASRQCPASGPGRAAGSLPTVASCSVAVLATVGHPASRGGQELTARRVARCE